MKPPDISPRAPWLGGGGPARAEDADSPIFYVRPAGSALMALHGLVHLMGMQLLWKMGEPAQLTYSDAVPTAGTTAAYAVGALWALAAALFLAASALAVTRHRAWRYVAASAALLSAGVISLNASMARIALAIDAIVLVAVAWSFIREHRQGQPTVR